MEFIDRHRKVIEHIRFRNARFWTVNLTTGFSISGLFIFDWTIYSNIVFLGSGVL